VISAKNILEFVLYKLEGAPLNLY